MIRTTVLITLLAVGAPQVFADQESKTKKIDDILQLMKADQVITQMQAQLKSTFQAQLTAAGVPNAQQIAAEMDRELSPVMTEALSWQKLKPRMTELYQESFTEDEIAGILDFYRSPAGRAMLEKMPALMAKSMAMSQEMLNEVMPKIAEVSRRVMEKYSRETAPAAPKAEKKN